MKTNDKLSNPLYMALNQKEQFKQLLAGKERILIAFRPEAGGDGIGSAVALARLLEHLGKRADIVAPNFDVPKNFRFLAGAEKIKNVIDHLQKFILLVDVTNTGIKELSYDVQEKNLRIFITPEHGILSKENIRTAQSDFTYDVAVILGTPDLSSLGGLYGNNTEFFFKTPILNIDNAPANEQFGQLNIIDLSASTVAELLFSLFKESYREDITPDIAAGLLTGIIAGTNSFRDGNIRPATLAAAAELVRMGADRALIIKHLYQTKSIATFRLWGAALSHLQYDETIGLAWSSITREDFIRSGAKENELRGIVDELIKTAPAAKLILLIHEHSEHGSEQEIHALFQTGKNYNALRMLAPFKPAGSPDSATFMVKGADSLRGVEEKIIAHIREELKNNSL